jgi:acyl carrier protein
MPIASRTPEGWPNRCPVCGAEWWIEPSQPTGDAPCPACGVLVWFDAEGKENEVAEIIARRLGVSREKLAAGVSLIEDLGVDSLDIVELIMELEEEFEIAVQEQDVQRIRTIDELIEFILRRMRDKLWD